MTDDDLPYIPGEEEPYSPVDDEDVSGLPKVITTTSIHQKMEELTRKIEKEKLVIKMMTAGSQILIADDDVSIIFIICYFYYDVHFLWLFCFIGTRSR